MPVTQTVGIGANRAPGMTGAWFRAFVLAVAVMTVGLAIMLVPGRDERQAILLRDGMHTEALAQLSRRNVLDTPDHNLAMTQVRLLGAKGRHQEALDYLEAYTERAPNDLQAHLHLLRSLQDLGRDQRLLEVAEQVFRRWRRPEAVTVLLMLHAGRGDSPKELAILRQAAFVGLATIPQLERLALIEAAQANHIIAIQHLVDVDATRLGLTRSGRLALLDLLISQQRWAEVERRVMNWLRKAEDGDASPAYCVAVSVAGKVDLAWSILLKARGRWAEHVRTCITRLVSYGEPQLAARLLQAARTHRNELCSVSLVLARTARQIGQTALAAFWTTPVPSCPISPQQGPKSSSAGRAGSQQQ